VLDSGFGVDGDDAGAMVPQAGRGGEGLVGEDPFSLPSCH
jgi:hypothetical protein